jgi:hypothetical protein
MADKAKHAFGALENIDAAIAAGKIDAYDILFVKDANGVPYVGWVDKDGNKVVCDNQTDLSGVEAELATKADIAEVEKLEDEVATKVDAVTVKIMIEEATSGLIEVVEF